MAAETKPAKLRTFAHAELELLVKELYTAGIAANAQQVLGALVLAARRSPIEAVGAIVQTYVAREAVES
jgi:hypothetical protein